MNPIQQRSYRNDDHYRPTSDPVCEHPQRDVSDAPPRTGTARRAVDRLVGGKGKQARAMEALIKGGDLLKLAAEASGTEAAIHGAEAVAAHTAGRAASALSGVASLLQGAGAAHLMIEGYRLGFQQITRAHQKAHEHGVRVKTAAGLARVLTAATRDPKASIASLRAKVTRLGKQDDGAQRALNTVMRRGRELPQDVRKRRETVEGHQRGMEAGLKIVANLSATQRAALSKVAMQQTGKRDLDLAMREIANDAIGVGRK